MVLEEGVIVPYTGSNTSLCWAIPRTWKTTTTELLHRPLVGDKYYPQVIKISHI